MPPEGSKKELPVNVMAEDCAGFRPCLILAHADADYAAQVLRTFRRHGWDVYTAQQGPQVRRLARMLQPQLVVLQADLPDESGWLTCNKLTREIHTIRVVLVADSPTPTQADFASFVGATSLVNLKDGMAAFLRDLRESALALPAVG
jgi:ActR/RegA family two-component response regulator